MSDVCIKVQKLMSPFIDSMVSAAEAERVGAHVSMCQPCRRQLQSLVSMRSLLTRTENPAVPKDLALTVRVRLSQERHKNRWNAMETRFNNVFKPLAVPALLGVSLTMLFFGTLLGSMASNVSAMPRTQIAERPVFSLYQPVRTTDPTMIRFATIESQNWDDPLMIETDVDVDGHVTEYHIISGPANPETERWIRDVLSLARFTPAIAFGKPVGSKIILSFVAVRS